MQQFEITAKANTKEAEAQLKKLSRSTEEAAKANLNLADSFDELEKAESKNREGFKLLDTITGGYSTKLIDFGKQIKGGIEGVKGLSASFKGLKTALLSTGLGAIVVGLGVIIAYWDDIKDSITGATEESKAYKEAQSQILSAVSKVQGEITKMGNAIELAKQGTISKEEALQQYNKALGESVGYAESLEQAESLLVKNAATVIEVTRLKAQSEVLYAKAAEARAKVIAGDESLEPSFWQTISNAVTSSIDLVGGAGKFATKQAIDTAKNGQEAIKTAEQLEGSAASLQTKIAELQKGLEKGSLSPQQREKRNTEIKALEDKAAAEAIQREKDKAAALESIRQALIDTEDERRNEELRKIQANYEAQIALAEQYYGKESETVLALRQAQKDAYDAQQLEFYEKDAEAAIARDDKEKARNAKQAEELKAIEDKKLADIVFNLEAEEAARQAQIGIVSNSIAGLQNIFAAFGKESDALAIAGIITEQVGAISKIISNTTVANAKAIAASPLTVGQPFVAFNTISAGAGIAGSVAGAVKAIADIKSKKKTASGGGAAVSSGGTAPVSQPPAFNVVGEGGTNQLAQVIGQQTQQPVQAYVVANDITSTQSLQRNIQTEAGLG
jgi:hypothetical protein